MSKYSVDSVYIDGANPSFIKSLKLQIGEEADYDKVIARYRSEGLGGAREGRDVIKRDIGIDIVEEDETQQSADIFNKLK